MGGWAYSLFTKRRVCLSETWETKCSCWIRLDNFCTHCSFQIELHRERSVMGWLIDLISHFSAESNSEKTSLPLSVWSIYDINVKSGRWKDRRNLFQCNLSDISGSSPSSMSLSSLLKKFLQNHQNVNRYLFQWLVICICHMYRFKGMHTSLS